MIRSPFRLLTLSALLAATLASPAFAEDSGAPHGPKGMMKEHMMEGKDAGDFKKRMDPAERFKKDDTNGDGFLTKDEMLAAHQKRIDEIFERMDANQDGKLSQDEMKKAREARREKMKDLRKERREKMGDHPAMSDE